GVRPRKRLVADAQELEHQGQRLAQRFLEQEHGSGHLLARGAVVVVLGDAEVRAQVLENRKERRRPGVRESVCLEHLDAALVCPLDGVVAWWACYDSRYL